MNYTELIEYKQKLIDGKVKKIEKTDITEAIKSNKDEVMILLQEISALISTSNDKTTNQIRDIESKNLPLALKTYRFLNPFVGACLLRKTDEKYYFFACCRDANGNDHHAEYTLLKEIIREEKYTSVDILFTTLEPCTRNSRKSWSTSCSELIVTEGIQDVYIGSLDPNPLVTGQGVKYLIDNSVNVHFYNKGIMSIIKENNKVFLNQFELPKGDPQKYKDIFDSFYNYLDFDTIEKYIALTIGELRTIDDFADYDKKTPSEKYRDIFEFFREMVMNRSILLADREVEKFVCTNDFALFFFHQPKILVDGSSIRIINKGTGKETIIDRSLYQVFDEIANVMREVFFIKEGNKVGKNKPNNSVDSTFKQVEDKFNKKTKITVENESIIKELLINALVHRDYLSHVFTEITIDENYIEIKNPITDEIEKNFKKISDYSFESKPVNGRLMRFFMDIKFCERKSHGLKLAEKFKVKYDINGLILIARFEKCSQE